MERRDVVKAMAAAAAFPRMRRRQAPDWAAWRIDGARLNGWMDHMAGIGHGPDGWVRIGFSDAVIEARQYAMELMRAADLDVSIDPAGNVIGRRGGSDPSLKPIVFGSHVDSVMNGGNYDGIVGSLGAIAAATALAERKYRNRHPLWVAIWCDEESGLTGSRGFLGDISAEELARPGRDGVPLGDKIKRIGGDPSAMAGYRHAKGDLAGYLELHIEQGGNLEKKRLRIGVVEGIVGIRSWDVTITGFANHAGTTPMDERHNALLAAAELILAVDRIVRAEPGRQVGTVGRLLVKPNAQNVVPGEVVHSIELRDLSMDKLAQLWDAIRTEGDRIMARREVTWTHVERPVNVAALSDPVVRDLIADATTALDLSYQVMPSGAGHDAQDLARLGPMGMIFVPSVGGISHSPKEFTRPEDVTNGANVLLQSLLRLDRR